MRTMLATATGRPCGVGSLPLVEGRPAPLPYTVLYPLGGPVGGAPFADAAEDAHPTYQVTVVAARSDQAEWLADRVRRAFLARTPAGGWESELTAPGISVWGRQLIVDEAGDSSTSDVVTYIQRYRLDASKPQTG
ncbi:hypothetical protein ACFW6V_34620 [Streptomyces sp. NPDC058734]|uniref:hypothetical protein n=1 Tax=Streptomyces sp. NPDC058734 TaxID=3346615 RepID=UPI0036B3112E